MIYILMNNLIYNISLIYKHRPAVGKWAIVHVEKFNKHFNPKSLPHHEKISP